MNFLVSMEGSAPAQMGLQLHKCLLGPEAAFSTDIAHETNQICSPRPGSGTETVVKFSFHPTAEGEKINLLPQDILTERAPGPPERTPTPGAVFAFVISSLFLLCSIL